MWRAAHVARPQRRGGAHPRCAELSAPFPFAPDFRARLLRLQGELRRRSGADADRGRSSPRRGHAEFRDHRAYVAGDDVRLIDWNVLLRSDDLLVKTFVREEAPEAIVILDRSPSMGPPGSVQDLRSREVAASLLFLAAAGGGRARLLVPEGASLRQAGLWQGAKQAWDGVTCVAALDATTTAADATAVERLESARASPRIAAWISDFLFDPLPARAFAALGAAGARAMAFAVCLHDDALQGVRAGSPATLRDAESAHDLVVESSSAWRDALARARAEHLGAIADLCRRYGAGVVLATAPEPFEALILAALTGAR